MAVGFDYSCATCGELLLPSLVPSAGGRRLVGYCLACATGPTGSVPLVPLTWSKAKILKLWSTYHRQRRARDDDARTRFPKDLLVGLSTDPKKPRTTWGGGRPRKLSDADVNALRRVIEHDRMRTWFTGLTAKTLADQFKVHPRTIRHYLKRHGLKLKKRPRLKLKKRPASRT